jgi:hypothetical protein
MAVVPSGRGTGAHPAAEDGVDLVVGVRGVLGARSVAQAHDDQVQLAI